MDLDEMIYQTKVELHKLIMTDWLTNDLFSSRWWGMIVFIGISYTLCFSLLDKRRFSKIMLFGALISVSCGTFDTFGVNFSLWTYTTRIFPIVPSLFFSDFTIYPLYYMLVYQYTSSWRQFFIWNAITAGVIYLVLSPILINLHMLTFHNWKPIYNLPIMFAIASLARAVTLGIVGIEQRRQESTDGGSRAPILAQPAMKRTYDEDNPED